MSYCGIVVVTFCIAQHFPMTLFGILLAVLNFGHGLGGRVICLILDLYERPMCWMLLTSAVFESFHLVSGILSVFVSVFVLSSDLCPECPMYLYPCIIGSFNLAFGMCVPSDNIVGDLCVLSLTWLSVLCVKCSQPVSLAPIDWKYPPRALVHPCPAFPMVSSGNRYLVFGSIFWYLVFDLQAQILPSNKVAIIIYVAFAYPFHRDIPSGISDTHFSFTQMNRT